MSQIAQLTPYNIKAIEILENFIKTRKIFTAFHITALLRKCGYNTPHYEIRNILNSYDIQSKGYTKTLSSTGTLKIAAYLYHHIAVKSNELATFEQYVANVIANGGDNSAMTSSATQTNPTHSVTVAVQSPNFPINSVKLKKTNVDEIVIKTDYRGRFTVPANVVRKYFTSGDKIGIFVDSNNQATAFEKHIATNAKLYSTVLTVDRYSNIRIPSKFLFSKNGKVSVEYADRTKQIYLREV